MIAVCKNGAFQKRVIHLSTKDEALQADSCRRQIRSTLEKLESSACRGSYELYSQLVEQCSVAKSLADARRLHAQLEKDGFMQKRVLSNLVVRMYGACGGLREAERIFWNLHDRNVFSFNIMINTYAQNGHLDTAKSLFDKMPCRTDVSWTAMISAYAQNGDVCEARNVFDQVPEMDRISWNAMITAYAQADFYSETLRLFRNMDLEGLQPDKIAFISAVNCCATTTCLELGHVLYTDVVHLGLISDISVATAFVSLYGRCGKWQNAEQIFNRMPEKNIVSWTAMVAAYAQNGHLLQSKQTFDQCPLRNEVTWNALVAAYAQNGQLLDARDVFDRMPLLNVVAWNTLIAAYGQKGHVDEARSLFNSMPSPGIISYNSIISSNAQNGYAEDAVKLLGAMDLDGVQPNRVTFLAVLEACSHIADLNLGRMIHSFLKYFHFQHHFTIATALVIMYAKSQAVEEAKSVYDEAETTDMMLCNSMLYAYTQNGHLTEARAMFDALPRKNIVSGNVILTGYVQSCKLEEAKQLFDEMPEKDVVSRNSMMLGYAQSSLVNEARATFDDMDTRNLVSWNTMITAYAQNGHPREAWELFKLLDLEGLQANNFTYVAALEACCALSSMRKNRIIHSMILESQYDSDASVATGLVNLYGKCGNIVEARLVFEKMSRKNMVSWNAMMTAYAQTGHNTLALDYFSMLQQDGAEPDAITFITAISACSHSGLVENARRYFVAMQEDYGIEPIPDHYACMIDLLGRAGKVKTAESLIQNMPIEPETSSLTALLNACCIHGALETAFSVGGRLFAMGGSEGGPYMLMSNIFRSTEDLDKLERVEKILASLNEKNMPGQA